MFWLGGHPVRLGEKRPQILVPEMKGSACVSCISAVSITTLSWQVAFDAVLRDGSRCALKRSDLDALRSVMDPGSQCQTSLVGDLGLPPTVHPQSDAHLTHGCQTARRAPATNQRSTSPTARRHQASVAELRGTWSRCAVCCWLYRWQRACGPAGTVA